MPVVLPTDWPGHRTELPPEELTWAETVPGGRYTLGARSVAPGRLRDLTGSACANLLLWRADAQWERLNVADTVKVPGRHTRRGSPAASDQGRVLATVVADDSSITTHCAERRRWQHRQVRRR